MKSIHAILAAGVVSLVTLFPRAANGQKVFRVNYESLADEDRLWYFVKYESQAGWQKPEKQHILLRPR